LSSNRRYIKRLWRVPKDRGALEMFAALVTKALVKHGWPASYELTGEDEFAIRHVDKIDLPPDMETAVGVACRVTARVYRVQVSYYGETCWLHGPYIVTDGGHFKLSS
jgi:hypothetical protein